jgi:hypothetical protein
MLIFPLRIKLPMKIPALSSDILCLKAINAPCPWQAPYLYRYVKINSATLRTAVP